MTVSTESPAQPVPETTPAAADTGPDRRADIDAKQARLAAVLQEVGCEGLLVLEPENFAWLTSGASARNILNPAELPALYYSAEGRWALSSNVDSQRLFDEELDGLGFQLKEWPWHWGREQLLADLCQGRGPLAPAALAPDRLRTGLFPRPGAGDQPRPGGRLPDHEPRRNGTGDRRPA
jgi:hypothetical protein